MMCLQVTLKDKRQFRAPTNPKGSSVVFASVHVMLTIKRNYSRLAIINAVHGSPDEIEVPLKVYSIEILNLPCCIAGSKS